MEGGNSIIDDSDLFPELEGKFIVEKSSTQMQEANLENKQTKRRTSIPTL